MRYNPLEPRIPETPPWAIYAQGQYDWKPSAGVYLTPVWEIAAQYAGGHALAGCKVLSEDNITIEIPIILGIEPRGLPIITDPDAALVLNEAYNAFRRESRENIWRNLGELTLENLDQVVELPVASWMTNIDGLWGLFHSFVEENSDVLRPLKMISQFSGPQAAIDWLNAQEMRRGYPVNVFYKPLPDDFIRYATQMYMCPQEIGWNHVVSVTSMTLQGNNEPNLLALWNHEDSSDLMYHGTTFTAAFSTFPEIATILPEKSLEKVYAFWRRKALQIDLEQGAIWQQIMEGMAKQSERHPY